jgi:hypothetical protein
MANLSRRLQVLIDEDRWARLEDEATQRGASVGTLVREAIDLAFPQGELTAIGAAEGFLALPARNLGDWKAAKREIEESMESGLPA